MDLSARSVEATVLRGEVKNTLEKLWCEGRVHVRQDGDPAKPDDKGVDIKGSTMQIDWQPDGNLMTVAADDKADRPNEDDLAQMLVNNLYIIGPEINVDQALNKVWVVGSGAMMMESATTLNGTKTAKPIPLTIHWNKSMLFTGKSAMFQGDIQAEQDNGRMACESLTVFFDRNISLKEGGNKGEKSAKVEHLVCDRKVLIEEATPETDKATGKERVAKYQKIRSVWVEMEVVEKEEPTGKDTNKLHASGPGAVWLFERGGTDPLAAPEGTKPRPAPKPGDQDVMKLTYVEFGKTMHANNKTGKASFWGGVRVLNMPCEDLRIEVNLDDMVGQWPKDAMYLTSDRLEVVSQKTPQGKTYQEMTATSRVTVDANEFSARCDTLYFNEAKDQIIFRGNENGKATLVRRLIKGEQGKTISGKEIIYIRSTGEFKVDGGDYIISE
jgi:lipopolysaccharide export system protein LptA